MVILSRPAAGYYDFSQIVGRIDPPEAEPKVKIPNHVLVIEKLRFEIYPSTRLRVVSLSNHL